MDRTLEFRNAVSKFPKSTVPARIKTEDPWVQQAQQVAINLRSFSAFLKSIRRAYLDVGSSSHSSHSRQVDASKGLAAWEGVRWMSDKERDEIDFGVKIALRRSVDRVRELEKVEKARSILEANVNAKNNRFTRLLGLEESKLSDQAATIASHRNFITLYLNNLLAHVSQMQREQQETRIAKQLEKATSLGGIGGAVSGMEAYGRTAAEQAKAGKSSTIKGSEVPQIYQPAPIKSDEENDFFDEMLTQEQIQQFEAEESALLNSTRQDLESVKKIESSLLEIAALQSQLTTHLMQQIEVTDKLYDEAIGYTGRVEEGNVQLKQARERNKQSRIWLLIMLMMASGTLLFLDYYA